MALLHALGAHREVHLWLPQASAAAWEAVAPVLLDGPVPRRQDTSAERVNHPLLASLGRDARELQRTLTGAGARAVTVSPPSPEAPASTLLGWLQDDLRHDRAPGQQQRTGRVVALHDRSVQVHACHSPSRQVDVLREVLTGLLQDDLSLEPRDILVMCPDIETYAPLIQAGFGLGEVTGQGGVHGHPAHQLRVLLADRALTSTNPLLDLAGRLVDLAASRVTVTQVLDLLALAPVTRRFGLDEEDLETVARWTREAAIRWGLDADDRRAYQIPWDQNTWRFGLDRLLAGVAMAEVDDHDFDAVLPVDGVPSGTVDLVGRLAELVDRLGAALEGLGQARTAAQWAQALDDAVRMLGKVTDSHAWQEVQLERELAEIASADQWSGGAGGTVLSLADVSALLEHRMSGRPTRANFRVGTLTVCTMVPMRSVPHRVVALLGLDDGVFPRRTVVEGDDVLARTPVTGERDPRSEDRQLLLDAVMAAGETLVVTYTGANELTGAERPPAVPLGELIDAVEATATLPVRPGRGGGPAHSDLVVRHPLQPFDRRNFQLTDAHGPEPLAVNTPGPRGGWQPFSFDAAGRAGAGAAVEPRRPRAQLTERLPARPHEDVALAQLQRFFRDPARAFLQGRLDVSTPWEGEATSEAVPIQLDGLTTWAVADRMLQRLVDGGDPDTVVMAELRRGTMPPGPIGEDTLREMLGTVQALYAGTAPLRREARRSVDIDVGLPPPDGGAPRRLTGTVTGVHGTRLVRVSYSRLAAGHRLSSWLDLVALTVAQPETAWTAHTWGRPPYGSRALASEAVAGPVDPARARAVLDRLVQMHDLGQRFPVPLPARTALAFAAAAEGESRGEPAGHGGALSAARREWETDRQATFGADGENASAANERVYGPDSSLEVLLGPPTAAEEGWNAHPWLLARYAWALWEPLLTGLETVDLR